MTQGMKAVKTTSDIAAMLANCRQYWLNYSLAPLSHGPILAYQTRVPHPQLNGIIQIKMPDPDAILQVASQLRGIPSVWWIGADSYAGASQDVMNAGGRMVAKVPVMAMQLEDLNCQTSVPANITVERLNESESLSPWVHCYSEPMGVAEEDIETMLYAEEHRSDAPGQLIRFAARSGGEIVGTSELFIHQNIAGIYLVSTKKSHQRRGVGTALTQAACMAGLEHGLKIATLQASSSGHPVYRKMGFQDVTSYDLLTFAAQQA